MATLRIHETREMSQYLLYLASMFDWLKSQIGFGYFNNRK
jgi:hypothetical protein